ncbi:MAG: cytidine deaminase [Alphaproteobacteria bacterium]|nr:cytidine deaminase [Alphaproteobacteria bacterium]
MNNQEHLLQLAENVASNAYAPYSRLKVGAAISTPTGNFYTGCNVENISFPNGTCAETGAISAMISAGDNQIAEILIYADSPTLITPCGACRQRILEFATPNTIVHIANSTGIKQSFSLSELIPHSFKEF